MIHVGVLSQRGKAKSFIDSNNIPEDDVLLYAEEGENLVGFAALRRVDDRLHVAALEYADEAVCELTLRAAASYAERRFIRRVTTALSQPERVLSALGFRLIDGLMETDVNNVVHMCRNCENHD